MALKEMLVCDHCEELIPEDSKQAVIAEITNGNASGTYDFLNMAHLSEWASVKWDRRPGRRPGKRKGRKKSTTQAALPASKKTRKPRAKKAVPAPEPAQQPQ